jgi:hypothetical protein
MQMWAGVSPDPGADVAAASAVLAQMWHGRARTDKGWSVSPSACSRSHWSKGGRFGGATSPWACRRFGPLASAAARSAPATNEPVRGGGGGKGRQRAKEGRIDGRQRGNGEGGRRQQIVHVHRRCFADGAVCAGAERRKREPVQFAMSRSRSVPA